MLPLMDSETLTLCVTGKISTMSKFNKLNLNDIAEEGFLPLSKAKSDVGYATTSAPNNARSGQSKFAIPSRDPLAEYFKFIDYRADIYVQRLKEAVAIQSVSAWPSHRGEIFKMLSWTEDWIKKLGGETTVYDNPQKVQKLEDGKEIPLPPILLGQFGNDPSKKTVCVYGHLDVQPALKSDGWDTDPFELTEIDGKLFGRGSTDDKGPALSWLWMIEALQELKMPLPVNIKIIFEGMEEYAGRAREASEVESEGEGEGVRTKQRGAKRRVLSLSRNYFRSRS